MDLHPGKNNVYLTSHFILSVLFLILGDTSEVPTPVRHPPSHSYLHLIGMSLQPAFSLCLYCV